MPSKKKKKSKVIPGQALLGIKALKTQKSDWCSSPVFPGVVAQWRQRMGWNHLRNLVGNGTKVTVEITVTISDGVHRAAKLTTTPSGAVDAKTLRKLKTDLNRTHY
jgi:hypothetical protein